MHHMVFTRNSHMRNYVRKVSLEEESWLHLMQFVPVCDVDFIEEHIALSFKIATTLLHIKKRQHDTKA